MKEEEEKKKKKKPSQSSPTVDELFDDDASDSSEDSLRSIDSAPDDDDEEDDIDEFTTNRRNANALCVESRLNRRYGAVACQVHARGVHTSLLMDVAVSEDGLYAFGGVQRGSVELAAVYLGDVEGYLDERFAQGADLVGDLALVQDLSTPSV